MDYPHDVSSWGEGGVRLMYGSGICVRVNHEGHGDVAGECNPRLPVGSRYAILLSFHPGQGRGLPMAMTPFRGRLRGVGGACAGPATRGRWGEGSGPREGVEAKVGPCLGTGIG